MSTLLGQIIVILLLVVIVIVIAKVNGFLELGILNRFKEGEEKTKQVDSIADDKTISLADWKVQLLDKDGKVKIEKEIPSLLDGSEFLIGRDIQCDFVIDDNAVTKIHAKVMEDETGYYIKDCDSRNGTFYHEKRISQTALKDGMIVYFAICPCRFRELNYYHVDNIGDEGIETAFFDSVEGKNKVEETEDFISMKF